MSSSLLTPSPLEFEAGKPVNVADGRFGIARCLSKRDDDVEGGVRIQNSKKSELWERLCQQPMKNYST